MSSIDKLMKQASRIQQRMQQVQEGLVQKTVEAASGGGVVKVVVRGDMSVASIKIDPAAVAPDDVAMLQDLVLMAVNDGLKQAKALQDREMGAVTSGISLPGMPGMF